MEARVLLVEDEKKLADVLADYLRQGDFEVTCIYRGDEVLGAFRAGNFDAVLLDIMLPGVDGVTLCRELRQFSSVPILMLTARVEEVDRLLGLELGADDYICKPYSPREVVARLKAVLRRSLGTLGQQAVPYHLDASRLSVQWGSASVELTAVEYHLFARLLSEPGRIFSRGQLMRDMYPDNRVVSDRTIDSHIKKLRKKLGQLEGASDPIESVYGVGYRFQPGSGAQ